MSISGCIPCAALLAFSTFAASGTFAAAQGNKQQVVMLPDPTPRQPDLEQKYSHVAANGTATDHAATVLSQQRRALISRASDQLATLAAALNTGILKHEKGTSLAPEVQVADLIEKLAKNVNAAVKLDAPPASAGRTLKTEPARTDAASAASALPEETPEAQLRHDAGKLVFVVQELQAEVAKTDQDTLSLGVITKSAEVERAAKSLKERLKKRADG